MVQLFSYISLIVVCFDIFSYTERFWSAVKLVRLSIRFKVSLYTLLIIRGAILNF